MNYISVEEAAHAWQISERSASNYCAHGRVESAFLEGKTWKIPSTAEKPDRKPCHSSAEETLLASSSVLGIDEPFRGLNKNEISHVANYLTSLLDEKKTIIVIDHEEEGFKYFSNKQELKNIDNVLIGK